MDQYNVQGMFGDPVRLMTKDTTFRLVWMYREKVLDKWKKARCTCNGSPPAEMARVRGPTYAGYIDHTTSRMFYALSTAEGMQISGANVTNTFGDTPPPAQGMHILPDKAFHEWWVEYKCRDPIPAGYVMPVLAAMQGHPQAPKLWAKHAYKIIRKMKLLPITHEACLYSGMYHGARVLLKRQKWTIFRWRVRSYRLQPRCLTRLMNT